MGSGEDESFVRVSEMFRAVRATSDLPSFASFDGEIQRRGFTCYDDSIDTGDSPLTIQAGDILGACVPADGGRRRQLDIVGNTGQAEFLLEMQNVDGCTTEAIPSSIPADQLSTRNSRRLHLYANIGTYYALC